MKKVSISLMCADYNNLGEQVKKINEFTDMYHFDFMDGNYVPNLSLNFDMIERLNDVMTKPVNVHLMVVNPEDYIDRLIELDVDSVSFHLETISNKAFRLLKKLKENGIEVGVVLNPSEKADSLDHLFNLLDFVTVMTVDPGFAGQSFIPEMLDKIKELDNIRKEKSLDFEIEVDGSVNETTIDRLYEAGADIYILGNSGFFSKGDTIEEAAENANKYIPFR
jgi:D-allulose-6-phosphate 3-epimerase